MRWAGAWPSAFSIRRSWQATRSISPSPSATTTTPTMAAWNSPCATSGPLPQVIVPVPPRHLDFDPEQFRQPLDLQDFILRSVGDDAPPAHQHYALNLRDNVGQFVRH